MAYNPYKAVNEITKKKAQWHTAKEQGEDPTRYQQEAVQYYNELRKNGYGDVADELTISNHNQALDILARYEEPKPYDDWYGNITGKLVEQASTPKASESVNRILSAYEQNNNMLNGAITKDANGNVVTGLNADHYNTGKNQLDYINNYDITSQPWYENMMKEYQLGGSEAAKGQLASGASGNSGNIDSYAAANANRQQLAFTNAGQEAARQMAGQNMQFWQNLYDSMGGRLDVIGDQNNQALDIGAKYYSTDSAERQNALNQAAALEAQKMQAYIDEFLGNLSADTEKHKSNKEYEGTVYQTDAEKAIAEMEKAIREYEANKNFEGTVYKTDAEKAIAEMQKAQNDANNEVEGETLAMEGLYADLHDLYNMYKSKSDGILTLSDVYEAAVGLHPQYEKEIRNYINNLQTLASGNTLLVK